MNKKTVIRGIGSYLPEKILTNQQLVQSLDTSDEWIFTRTGISSRHIASKEENTSDLACKAALDTLEAAKWDPLSVDLIILATSTPDHIFPASATKVQAKIGAINAVAFDMNAACSGFLFALSAADAFLKNGNYRRALVIGAEINSRIVDWKDRRTAVLFGDGAGSIALEAIDIEYKSNKGILKSLLYTNGQGYDFLYVNGGPSSTQSSGTILMEGREVFKQAVQQMERLCLDIFQDMPFSIKDIDWFIPHQANKRIISSVVSRLGLSEHKVCYTMQTQANTFSATIPLAMKTLEKEGKLKEGQLLLLTAFGAGFTGGSILIRL